MFLPPPIEPTHERARAGLQRYQEDAAPISPPAAPFSKTPLSPSKRRAPPYLSMYDRLARSNGISAKRPISPTVKPILDPNPVATKPPATAALARPQSADQNAAARFQKSVAKQTTEGARGASAPRHSTASRSTVTHQDCWQEPQQQQRRASNARRSSVRADAPAPSLDDKQKNVLSVIQNLIQHKRQTLATLRTQKPGGTPPQSREYNFQSSVTDRTGVLSK